MKTDPLFRVGEMKVTCRKCDRGARNPLSASAADPGVALAWAPIGKGIPFPSSDRMSYVIPKRAHAATSCRGPIYPPRGPGRGRNCNPIPTYNSFHFESITKVRRVCILISVFVLYLDYESSVVWAQVIVVPVFRNEAWVVGNGSVFSFAR